IVFTMKDSLGQVVGVGRSPPIMITDDHKSSKMQQQAAARKRARAGGDTDNASESDAPVRTKRKMTVDLSQTLETDSGVSSPVASTPATPSSPIEEQEIPNDEETGSAFSQFYPSALHSPHHQDPLPPSSLPKTPNLPRLHRLIPNEGPVYGGAEVTVLGSNFYEGLTCLFGENPAIPTHCWSANTLLCILPPATSAGPVVVSFKEHPLMLEGQDVVLFTYFDESDRALMELALQVVGLKTMGKVEDARQIAMRIVQGDQLSNTTRHDQSHTKLTSMAHRAITALVALQGFNPSIHHHLSLTNHHQHTLLHLATLCGYAKLVKTLLALRVDVNQADKNGFTALHFASWTGRADIVKLLINSSNLQLINRVGKTAERLAIEQGHQDIVHLFKQRHKPCYHTQVRVPLTECMPYLYDVLPSQLTSALMRLYTVTSNTSCVRRMTHSAGQLYHFMLDPF
ncbi:hypothetical protein EDC96DRAFT_450769, partial [Choanephora cucurbitarum]